MSEEMKNELIYCEAYSILKTLFERGTITREVFEKLNMLNAETMHCQPITV